MVLRVGCATVYGEGTVLDDHCPAPGWIIEKVAASQGGDQRSLDISVHDLLSVLNGPFRPEVLGKQRLRQ